jgi:hypothetical protein
MQMNSKQITKRTMMLHSNDENTTTIIGSIDEIVTQLLTSFDHAQKWDNKGPSTNGQNMFQDISKVANSGVSSPFHPNMGGENQSNMIPSHMIHPSPLHPSIILWDFG